MSGPEQLPARLRVVGATNLEQKLLEAASHEEPSREISERLAAAIGISAPVVHVAQSGSATSGTEANTAASGSSGAGTGAATSAGASSGLIMPLIGGALVALVAVVFVAARPSPPAPPPAAVVPPTTEVRAAMPLDPNARSSTPSEVAPAAKDSNPPARTPRARAAASADLSDQIALVDAARSAVAAGSSERALGILRQYRDRYPAGSFRPEVTALQVEALVKAGRSGEARSLAERFVADHPGTPLAERVARLAELTRP